MQQHTVSVIWALVAVIALMVTPAAVNVDTTVVSTTEIEQPVETVAVENVLTDFSGYNVGDVFTFGKCEQDGKTSNGMEPLEWLVLDKFEDRITVISLYCLDSRSYYNPPGVKYKYTTYEECDLRKWLNGGFLNGAFTETERMSIALTRNINSDNPDYGIEGGIDTEDYIFLMSHDECMRYFPERDDRRAKPTKYCVSRKVDVANGYCYWWLRTPGKFRCNAEYVFNSGKVYTYGSDVGHNTVAVRPMMNLFLNDAAKAASGDAAWQSPYFASPSNTPVSPVPQ